MENKTSRLVQAFKENHNVVGLAGIVALSAAFVTPIPLLVGLVAEAAYLLFVPDSKWYEKRLASRFDEEVAQRRAQLKIDTFPLIPGAYQERFERLENIRAQVQAAPNMENADWFRQVVRKLDYLLEKFLMFARKDIEFRRYLRSVLGDDDSETAMMPRRRDRDDTPRRRGNSGRQDNDYNRGEDSGPPPFPPLADRWVQETVRVLQTRFNTEIASIHNDMEAEEDLNTKAIMQKRIEVLEQRREHVGRIGKILTNLGHQMQLLEDSFGLINDQLRARSPEQVLADIEGVVYQTDSMTKLLDELAPYESLGV